jgi:hypothetical protein
VLGGTAGAHTIHRLPAWWSVIGRLLRQGLKVHVFELFPFRASENCIQKCRCFRCTDPAYKSGPARVGQTQSVAIYGWIGVVLLLGVVNFDATWRFFSRPVVFMEVLALGSMNPK